MSDKFFPHTTVFRINKYYATLLVMNISERAIAVKKILDKTYPKTPVPLKHKDNFSLLAAVLLSAQCTD